MGTPMTFTNLEQTILPAGLGKLIGKASDLAESMTHKPQRMLFAPQLYSRLVKQRREKIAPEILRLTDELSQK